MLKPLIAGQFYNSGGGGSPGLPVWTYTAGAMGAGKVTTDNVTISLTGSIVLSKNAKNGGLVNYLTLLGSLPIGGFLVLTNSAGKSYAFQILSRSSGADSITISVTVIAAVADAWSGDYQLSSWSAVQTALPIAAKQTAANYTVGTSDPAELYGGVIEVTSAATITIPAVAPGMNFSISTTGAIAVSADPNASDLIVRDGVAQADGEKITNLSTAGDLAVFTARADGTGWLAATNGWTNGG